MGKLVNVSDVKAVGFTALKFHATEDRKERIALEIAMFDQHGNFLRACTAPFHAKAAVAAVGMGAPVVSEGVTRRPFGADGQLFTVSSLSVVEGEKVGILRLHGDYDVVALSPIKRLVRKDIVADFDPFA